MNALRRLRLVESRLASPVQYSTRNFSRSAIMSQKFDLNTVYRMNSGYDIPVLGYGVYQTPAKDTSNVVTHALKVGYRHVDSAAAYRNEEPCAEALLASGLPRSSYFFTSKVPPNSISYDGAKSCVEESLKKCKGLEYIDLFLLHAPYGGKDNRLGAWRALTEAVAAGKVRSIGVSNYGVHHLDELEAYIASVDEKEGKKGAGGVLSVNQVELHPWLPRHDIVGWCKERGVLLEAYSPLARMTRSGDPKLVKVCKNTGKTETQVLVRWSLQKGFVPLPKSVTPKRIEENADIFGFELSQEDMKDLETNEYSPSAWDPTTTKE